MTEPSPAARNPSRSRWRPRAALLLILLAGAALRLHGVGFGLPALYDPDEPLFMMTALDMLRSHSLNPGWFGHPGTITLYCLALIDLAVAGLGIATGRFADMSAMVAAVYADPGILFLPARLFIVACGLGCVLLTCRIGRQLGGERLGLIAAALVAVNAVHIEYSQIIRTDMQATLFMLLCLQCTIAILRRGGMRDYVLAGIFVGLGCATKWPAAIVALSPLAAGLHALRAGRDDPRHLGLFVLAAIVTLFAVSPYLLLDHATVLRNLGGEARLTHPGATGGGVLANLVWYMGGPLLGSVGIAGLLLMVLGLLWGARHDRLFRLAILPCFLGYLAIICTQALRWERWIVPLLPLVALAQAVGVRALVTLLPPLPARWLRRPELLLAALLLVPMLAATLHAGAERSRDTRQVASGWVRAHVPAGRTILVEHAAFDLLGGPWRFLFPVGAAGCVDARQLLSGHVRYSAVEALRSGPVLDIGHIDPARAASCRPDYAILTHYDVYRREAALFPDALARYRDIVGGWKEVAVARPVPGALGGPTVRILERPQALATAAQSPSGVDPGSPDD